MLTGDDVAVETSLNLVLSSTAAGSPGSSVFIDAGSFGFGEVALSQGGTLAQRDGGLLLPSVNCSDCVITSKVVSLPTNTLLDFELLLRVESTAVDGRIDAMHTLSFPDAGFVFNLPNGYSASIEGMNVVDNRLVITGAVPEPSSAALALIGLLGVVEVRKRRLRVQPAGWWHHRASPRAERLSESSAHQTPH